MAANRRKPVTDSLKELESRQKAVEKVTLRLRLQRAGLEDHAERSIGWRA